jgi:hypothetical protein
MSVWLILNLREIYCEVNQIQGFKILDRLLRREKGRFGMLELDRLLHREEGQNEEGITDRLVNEYFSAQANRLITVNGSVGPTIDCEEWFGDGICVCSLWEMSFSDFGSEIPPAFLMAFQNRIYALSRERGEQGIGERPITISLTNTANLPVFFLTPLTIGLCK